VGTGPTQSTSWQAVDNETVQRVTTKALIYELIHEQTATIEQTVPWFLENMPESYFRHVPENFRMHHIKAVSAIKDANMDLYLNLQSHLADGRQVLTMIRPGTTAGTLLHMVQELPSKYETDQPLSRIHVFSTADESMSLNMFVYGTVKKGSLDPEWVRTVGGPILDAAKKIQQQTSVTNSPPTDSFSLEGPTPLFEEDALMQYLCEQCTETYIRIGADHPRRFLKQRLLIDHVSGTEGTAVHISPAEADEYDNKDQAAQFWVNMAVANSLPQVVLENMCRLLYAHQFDVVRARLDIIPDKDADSGSVTMLRTLVTPVKGAQSPPPETTWHVLEHELKRSKWLDPATHELVFEQFPELGVTRGEIITALCSLIHPVLAKLNALAFSQTSILETVAAPHGRFVRHAAAIADLFLDRFRPGSPLSEADFEDRCEDLIKAIDNDVEDFVASTVLNKMVDVVRHTLKTNVYCPDRYALGLRLDPACMVAEGEKDAVLPYGVFFVHGRRFNGYHVRFRDISRGGMRLVTPHSAEQFALESARQYEECYGLAYAQQLKNKDIPEGGSKAVNLINTVDLSEAGKAFVVRKSVKAMIDTILDLCLCDEEHIVDLLGKKEVLYLGPDEQVIPADIEWIVKRAAVRGYDTPAAFMSSKPRAG
jgi:glutamate dehydrogenase